MWGPRTTQLVGGSHDGVVLQTAALPVDILIVGDGERYVGLGRFTEAGHWEAVLETEEQPKDQR